MELFKLLGTIAIDNSQANKEIDETTNKASDSSESMVGAFKKIGAAVATYFTVDAIKNFGLGCINAAADANAAASQFSQVFGNLEGQASKALSGIADEAGISENRMKGSFTKIAAFAKTTGMDTESSLKLSERAMVAVADSAAFYDRSLEETTESLQSFLKGNYENDAALGLSCTEVTRNAAANDLYGKSFKDLSESQKQLTLLKMVEDANKTSGALGQAARESDTWTNVTGNLKQAWTDLQAKLGENVLPMAVNAIKSMAEKVTELSEKVPALIAWFEKYKGVLGFLAIAIGVVTTAVTAYNIVQGIQAAMNAAEVTSLSALIAMKLASAAATMAAIAPYVLIVAAIAAVVAIGVKLYKNWDTVKAKAIELKNKLGQIFDSIKTKISNVWYNIKTTISNAVNSVKSKVTSVFNSVKSTVSNVFNSVKSTVSNAIGNVKSKISSGLNSAKSTVSSVLGGIKSKFTSIFNTVKNTVSNAISKIKGMFNFKWSLPKLKMPHFSLKGKFSLAPPSVPKLSVSWYKKAMNNPLILDDPTIFGYDSATGRFLGGGEAGSEMVGGTNTVMNMISSAVANQNEPMVYYLQKVTDILSAYFPQVLDGMEQAVVLDDGTLVGRIAPKMDIELGRIKQRKGRGR